MIDMKNVHEDRIQKVKSAGQLEQDRLMVSFCWIFLSEKNSLLVCVCIQSLRRICFYSLHSQRNT
ncbi:unnamed protein product [Trichobilharzia regenti]|nr:unnamed protein product [Trichobilharzia regenti]